MEKVSKPIDHNVYKHIERLTIITLRAVIPLALLGGGLALFVLRIAGWSIVFGLPMIVIGVVFLIYTYDDISRVHDEE